MRQGKKHITYDSTNQLVSAANAQTYALSVTYGDWGKIQQYGLQQTDLASNTTTSQTRYYSYGSLNEGQTTFAPNSISYADGTNVNEQYGINGSLSRRETATPGNQPNEELYRFGADGNMRLYSYDRIFYSLYGYDGGTTRTYKYSFDLNPNWVNGRLEAVNFNLHNAMFYPNSYLNFNSNGYYTKHYYNGMERIASRLGDQNLPINVNDPELQDRKEWQDSLIRKSVVEITGYEFLEPGEEQTLEDPKPIYELPVIGISNLQPSADGIYYYHPNHLGSTCYVTDGNASVQQGFLYAPFGEITNEHNVGWQNGTLPKYSFNAKELDEETGMYYYEARYYAPPTFTSRDALFEKYPTFTPYAYCANNPIKYIDPDGRELYLIGDEESKKKALEQMNQVTSNLKFTIDDKGKVFCSGRSLYPSDILMKKIINSKKITVNLHVQTIDNIDGTNYLTEKAGGSFMGNTLSEDKKHVTTEQYVNVVSTERYDELTKRKGNLIWHEIAESYYGGKLALRTGKSLGNAKQSKFEYEKAHRTVGWFFPGTIVETPCTRTEYVLDSISKSYVLQTTIVEDCFIYSLKRYGNNTSNENE